ncbi:MAG: SDR family NAD(P)-dependent oxidoreductase [Nostoc sp. NMS1]|uniref:SDR family NAD(P)-dependent oxidoreductase n=1 Tax=unclassified Nostoc TaxID=2593658 RepID=UPI0025DC3B05|nr:MULTISPECIES: SDR family NAD(P)-dependent oxidoreductase [unclassified Nostoc]MBN3907022.1 SDR family NAD(P)-dependent oxidoreductase [Nostoc sp. NMS1]MBN3992066.1 SDR family NAD(P)-dependent oxidoreductase [Nostoc sp. NMS2]
MSIISGKTVLLTGASRGIGVFIARALAKEKATVVGVARSQQGLDRVSAEVKALGGHWLGITSDISDINSLPSLVEQINQLVGPIDILINNAGIEIYRPFQDYSSADLQSVLSTNLLAAMELSRLVLPTMLRQGSGHIVNIASLAAKKGPAYNSIYSASKAGMFMWSDAVRQELAGTGVEISVICPGYVSEQGMSADSGVAIPSSSGSSTPTDVAIATIQAIKQNQPEVIVNQDAISEAITKLLLALWEIFPLFGDKVNQWIGVTKLNKIRAENQTPIAFQPSESRTMVIATPNGRISKEKNQ